MLPLPRGAIWQLLFLFCAALYINGVRSEGRVVCYYTNWSVYRPGTAKFNPQNINPYLCTHLIYAFGGFTKDNQMKPFDKYQDIEQGGYAKFTGLKTYNKQLKTMVAIGGWNEASSRFSPLVANPERRQKFIKNILKFLRQNHFDGIDLDWEYPGHREGGKSRDRDNYAQFVQELRAELEREAEKTGRPRLLVTMAVPAGIEYIEKGYDIPKLNKYLDWFNVLTYDFHSSHEPSVNHHAPLYSLEEESEYNYDAELNIDYSIKFYLNAGADKDKLVLGIPTYGRSYTLINEESTEIGSPAEAPGEQGDATREKGYLAYYEICQNLKEDPEWTVVQPNPNAMGPYAYRRTQWVGYDDEAIVRKKAQYVVDNGLGGIMFWAIDNDDFRGTCTGKPYPLIEAAKDAMLEALGLGINEVSKPSAPQKPLRSRSRENSSSTRNRIATSEHKLTYAERKGSNKRTQQNTRNTQQSTTNAPVSIKLTEAEGSSLYIGGRTTTPPPPTTPDPGTDFKCEEEGFFQHPRDCKKYYWCLDSGPSGLGIVAHQFTCPSGLYFNPAADSCDFARNVPCKTKKSTTAAPVTTYSTTTTTTPRPTQSFSRITAATSRTSFFRTTSTTSTTTTTEAPEEEIEYEEDDEDNAASPFAKHKAPTDKEAEEDPQVIKELIELIRKVGGIEELEKHLLRKDDGTIAIKENSSSSSSSSIAATTASPISKSLYEKVLSKPNALNSFRNRFTSTSSFRNTQTKTVIETQDDSEEQQQSDNVDSKSSGASAGYSKYSSVVRGNSRQGPQSEGIEKSNEFDGLYKGKKQYTTINRGYKKASNVDEDEESVIAKSHIDSDEDDEDEVVVKTTKRPLSSNTLAYSTIRRTRPPTTTEATEEIEDEQEEKEVIDRKSYSSLNRSRARGTTTTEIPDVTAGSLKYKYLERTRPTRPTTETSNKLIDEDADDEESEDHENTVLLRDNENTRETQQEITTNTQRAYASIGRRTTTTTSIPETETTIIAAKTTTTTATSTTSTTETPITTPLTNLETTTPESIIITTTYSNIPITTTTNPTTISTTTATTSTKTTTLPYGEEVLDSLTTTPYPNEIDADSETHSLSLKINSLLTESASPTSSPTTESGLDTNKQENDILKTTTTTETTASITTEANEDVQVEQQQETNDEVTLVNKQRNKTLYTTRKRTTETPTIRTTTSNADIEATSSPTSTTNNKKTFGVRRQQLLLNRSSQTKTTTTDIPTTESVNNDFLGTVSSPRPFGFPKRRIRPTTSASVSTTTIEEIAKPNEESLVTKQKTTKLNAAVNNQTKVSSHNTILSQTASELETETSSQRDESEVAGTEHVNDNDIQVEQIKKHVVKEINGFEGNTNNILKHVNTVVSYKIDNSAPRIKTQTIVEEVDDDDDNGPYKLYSWRDARRPTKPTPKKKKLVVTEVTTEERVHQRVSPDHVTIVNVVEKNDKDVRFNKKEENTGKFSSKYRGKSLETSLQDDVLHHDNQVDNEQADDAGRAFKTYTTINKRRNQNEQSLGIGQDEVSLNGFKGTQVVRSDEEVKKSNNQYTSINRGQSAEVVSSFINENRNNGHNGKPLDDSESKNDQNKISVNTKESSSAKFKYTTLNRGHVTKAEDDSESGTEINKEISNTNDRVKNTRGESAQNSENNDTEKTKFEYTKITRGQSTQGTAKEGSASDAKTKTYTTLNRISGSQQEIDLTTQENSSFGNTKTDTERKIYTTITRNKDLIQGKLESDNDNDRKENSKRIYVSHTENIPYKSIVRDGDGVHLTEGELSGFVKESGVSTITTYTEKSAQAYETISRGSQINQSLDTNENDMKHSKMHEMDAMSLIYNNEPTESFDKANANNEDESDLTAEIEEVDDNKDRNSGTNAEISTTSTTTTEKSTTSPSTESKTTSTSTESKTTTIDDALSTSTEEIRKESNTEFITPEVLTERTLFRNKLSTTPSPTTYTEPTPKRYLLDNRGSTTTTEATGSTIKFATTNEKPEVEPSLRRTFIGSRTTASKFDDESTTQTPRRRTVLRRRRPVSGINEATVSEKSHTIDHSDNESVIKSDSQTVGNTRTTSFRRRTILRRKPSSIEHTPIDSEAQWKFDRDSVIRTTSETTDNNSKSNSGQYLSRGTYRPSEKGDLSSLLALDLAKKYGNKSVQSFGNGKRRRPVERTSTKGETEVFTNAETEVNESLKSNKELSLTLENSSTQTQIKGDNESLTETISTQTLNRGSYYPSEKNSFNKTSQELKNVELGSNVSSNTDDSLPNESESIRITEKIDSSKKATEFVNPTQRNDLSYNLKHNTTSQQTLDNVNSNTFNSQKRKNFFGTKSATENNHSHNLETDKNINKTESNNNSAESEKEQNSVDNNISISSGSKFQSRNSFNSQTQENSRKSSLYNRRGSFNARLHGNNGKTEEIETLEDGTTRIKTTNIETINEGGTIKTIKRTKVKTILKQAPEYEYETIDYSGSSTTRRPINRHRGSARFKSNDLSSLLALDFAAKSNRRVEGEVTASKSRRKIIRKPDIVTETEQVEEYEEEIATRPPRLSKTTTPAQEPIRRRTRPTKPLSTTTTTTRAPTTEEVEEKIVPTTRRNFAFKRPNSTTTTTTKAPATEKVVEDNKELTTRRKIVFKRPNLSTEEKLNKSTIIQREQQNETFEQRTELVNRFKLKQPTTTTESTSEQIDESTITYQTTPATTYTTTEAIMYTTEESTEPTAESTITTSTNPATTTSTTEAIKYTTEESTEPTAGHTTTTSTSPATTTTTTESIVFTSESPPQSTTMQYKENATASVVAYDPLGILQKQLAHAVRKLQTETVEVQKVTQSESSDGLEMKTQISSNKDINLPIYHRRKYYQYYKDSPIVYVNPITVAPHTVPQTNADIAKQIHDVFNVSNNHLIEPEVSEETEALLALEQAQEINSELGNFLVNSPGSG